MAKANTVFVTGSTGFIGTKLVNELVNRDSHTGELLRQVQSAGLLAGACARASAGCGGGDPKRDVVGLAGTNKIPLLADMQGHASVAPFVRGGYEIVTL